MTFWRFIVITFIFVFGSAVAEEYQDLGDIKQSVYDFVNQNINTSDDEELTIDVGHLDSRLRLSKCHIPLNLYIPSGGSAKQTNIVAVACEGIKPWRIYVPVKVKIATSIPVAAHPLAKGTVVSDDDIKFEFQNILALKKGIFLNTEKIIGKVVKHSMTMGSAFKPSDLQAPKVISKGDSVIILAEKGSLRVSMHGVAIKDGVLGEQISVRNKKSKRVVEGVVKDAGVVQVLLP